MPMQHSSCQEGSGSIQHSCIQEPARMLCNRRARSLRMLHQRKAQHKPLAVREREKRVATAAVGATGLEGVCRP